MIAGEILQLQATLKSHSLEEITRRNWQLTVDQGPLLAELVGFPNRLGHGRDLSSLQAVRLFRCSYLRINRKCHKSLSRVCTICTKKVFSEYIFNRDRYKSIENKIILLLQLLLFIIIIWLLSCVTRIGDAKSTCRILLRIYL